MYEVIGSKASRAFRVLWLLEELGVDYDHTPAGPRSAEAVAANPSGKIPALRVDGAVVTESVAIMSFLADRHGALTYKAGTLERARQDALTHQILDDVDCALWMAARHTFVLPEDKRVGAVKDTLKWEYEANIARLSEALEGPFLMGEEMTIPDILLVHCLRWAEIAKFPGPGEVLEAYRARLETREAFRKVSEMG
ncbi:Glutathione S-transferase [Roseovarius sp. THAF9]|uniref:glutathione S-transferase family protein n=1 Tax=Roseovarius sp. THAF9 TaxID=2587847 RepID=UPI001267F1F5|nr:glutathione S-transferase family protein [Roseovarius sp. THAF9]QFT91862.1 Glutathione S-transferase [Roseovarius sp. THAF9]